MRRHGWLKFVPNELTVYSMSSTEEKYHTVLGYCYHYSMHIICHLPNSILALNALKQFLLTMAYQPKIVFRGNDIQLLPNEMQKFAKE